MSNVTISNCNVNGKPVGEYTRRAEVSGFAISYDERIGMNVGIPINPSGSVILLLSANANDASEDTLAKVVAAFDSLNDKKRTVQS